MASGESGFLVDLAHSGTVKAKVVSLFGMRGIFSQKGRRVEHGIPSILKEERMTEEGNLRGIW